MNASGKVHMCGRSVMEGWFNYWGDPDRVTRKGYELVHHYVSGPDDSPSIVEDVCAVADSAEAGSAVFYKLCFVDFEGWNESSARENLERNKSLADQVVNYVVNTRGLKLIIGNALPKTQGETGDWLSWNHQQYNTYLLTLQAAHPERVWVFDLYGNLAQQPGGYLKTAYDTGDGHPNQSGYAALEDPYFNLLEWVFGEEPTPPDPSDYRSSFYFAEGYTGAGFQEYLCIVNITASDATVWATYMFTDGSSQSVYYEVAAQSRYTVNVNQAVGSGREVSALVGSVSPGLVVERPMYFDYGAQASGKTMGAGPGWSGGHDVIGAQQPSLQWFFAEGTTLDGFDEYITVFNPQNTAANLTFHYMVERAGEVTLQDTVGAHSRATFKTRDQIGPSKNASLFLESDQPVVAERPVYFDYQGLDQHGWKGGHCVLGATELDNQWLFAEGTTREGFEQWLCLQNPNPERITVNATYLFSPSQGEPAMREYTVEPYERLTVSVNREIGAWKDVSTRLTSDSQFLAERPVYFLYHGAYDGGHDVIGARRPAQDWLFAEGYTGGSFEDWLSIQNDNDQPANVTVTYYPENGGAIVRDHLVDPMSRYTVDVNNDAGRGLAISTWVYSDLTVIVERPIYFGYQGCNGGHNVLGFNP